MGWLPAGMEVADYARPRQFRERPAESLRVLVRLWPECPARISDDDRI
ncbi:MAG: hypothetical protein ABI693_16265 [Bryobacteraceae bacterium]